MLAMQDALKPQAMKATACPDRHGTTEPSVSQLLLLMMDGHRLHRT